MQYYGNSLDTLSDETYERLKNRRGVMADKRGDYVNSTLIGGMGVCVLLKTTRIIHCLLSFTLCIQKTYLRERMGKGSLTFSNFILIFHSPTIYCIIHKRTFQIWYHSQRRDNVSFKYFYSIVRDSCKIAGFFRNGWVILLKVPGDLKTG